MKLRHYKDTNTLYIDLAVAPSADSKEITDGVLVDFDEADRIVGPDIQHASNRLVLSGLSAEHLPLVSSAACPISRTSHCSHA